MSELLRVGITQGDLNGVGYEVIVGALASDDILQLFTPVVFGYPGLVNHAFEILGIEPLKTKIINDLSEVEEGFINIFPPKSKEPDLNPGTVSKEAGKVAVESLEMAVTALKNHGIDVLVTAPISKEAVQNDNFSFPGHTEFLEVRLGEGKKSQMILFNDSLRVALLSIHLPLSQVTEQVTQENVIEAVESFADTLKQDFGIERPTVAVLSLNPHAGDGGLLGTEEKEVIIPALEKLRDKGILAFGPFAADGFFGHGSFSKFDGVLAMYHDQGLAPFKTLSATSGVNFTANLPYVRTSPDHGTAFDIAWRGKASPDAMREAIYAAIDIYRRRMSFLNSSANPLKKYVNERPDRGERIERNN